MKRVIPVMLCLVMLSAVLFGCVSSSPDEQRPGIFTKEFWIQLFKGKEEDVPAESENLFDMHGMYFAQTATTPTITVKETGFLFTPSTATVQYRSMFMPLNIEKGGTVVVIADVVQNASGNIFVSFMYTDGTRNYISADTKLTVTNDIGTVRYTAPSFYKITGIRFSKAGSSPAVPFELANVEIYEDGSTKNQYDAAYMYPGKLSDFVESKTNITKNGFTQSMLLNQSSIAALVLPVNTGLRVKLDKFSRTAATDVNLQIVYTTAETVPVFATYSQKLSSELDVRITFELAYYRIIGYQITYGSYSGTFTVDNLQIYSL